MCSTGPTRSRVTTRGRANRDCDRYTPRSTAQPTRRLVVSAPSNVPGGRRLRCLPLVAATRRYTRGRTPDSTAAGRSWSPPRHQVARRPERRVAPAGRYRAAEPETGLTEHRLSSGTNGMPAPIEYGSVTQIVSVPERQPPDEATLCCPECGHESPNTATGRSTTSRPARRRVSGLWRPGRPPPESGRADRAQRRVAPVRGRALISAPRTSRLEQRGRDAGSPNSAPARRPTRGWDYVSPSTNSIPVTSNRAPASSVSTTEMSHP